MLGSYEIQMLRQIAKSVVASAPVLRPLAARVDYWLSGHKNLLYDERTVAILQRVLKRDSNVIDVGTHDAEVLQYVLELCPEGQHYAFEPLPEYASRLHASLPQNVKVCELALSDAPGEQAFFRNLTDSGRSGLRRTRYDSAHAVQKICVRAARMDDVLVSDHRVDLIKIDVEGAELLVLRGASGILERWRPFVVFEHGLGGADEAYGCTPEDLFSLLTSFGYCLFTLRGFLRDENPLPCKDFAEAFRSGREYYWLAAPTSPLLASHQPKGKVTICVR